MPVPVSRSGEFHERPKKKRFYRYESHAEINGNYIRQVVTWNRDHDVIQLAGTPVQLRFVMRDCKLYSFEFIDEQ